MKFTLNQIFVYFATFFAYAAFHGLRAGWSYSKSEVSHEFNISKKYLGVVDALYLVAYSSGLVILGSLLHRIPLKYYVVIGLTLSSVSFMFWIVLYSVTGFYNVVFMTIFIIIYGFFEATGWPGILGIFSVWFSNNKKGVLMAIWGCNSTVGDMIINSLLNLFQDHQINFIWNFVLTGGIALFVALILLIFLKNKSDTPEN